MISFPIAKINLGLRIIAKRQDGYHDIETIFYPFELCDALEFVIPDKPINKDILTTSGFGTGIDPEENLVIKAARKLHNSYVFPHLKIHLHKAIPLGAGLGGGSSDSSCFLKSINKVFSLKIPANELKSISLELGSDCPFFIENIPALATGRGEILKPLKYFLEGYYLMVLNPGLSISTREAYENCIPTRQIVSFSDQIDHPITEWKKLIVNDFEDFAFRKHPLIGEIKSELYISGALFSLMSGSGSSVFGIFSEKPVLPEKLKELVIFEGQM